MGLKTTAAIHLLGTIIATAGLAGAVRAADWQPIGNGADKIEIDRSRISVASNNGPNGNGQVSPQVSVWSRLVTAQVVADAEGKYNSVEALNRYDCAAGRFATLKRLYLMDNALVRAEPVLAPREMAASGVDVAIMAEVCQPFAQKAETPPQIIPVSNSALATENKVSAKPLGLPSFVPRIDPSQVQRPTDEPKPEEVKRPILPRPPTPPSRDPLAVSSEAAKAGVKTERPKRNIEYAHANEMALAMSASKKTPKLANDAEEAALPGVRHEDIHWSYDGEGAPDAWSRLRADYGLCSAGKRQSPIDIREGIGVDLEPIKFDYRLSPFRIVDNGHTVQASFGEGNSLSVMGRNYQLVQLHFHRPSEERVNGRAFDMVMHMVHKDLNGQLAVVAVLIERGATEHPVIQTFWNHLPLETNVDLAPATAVDLNKLLPANRAYYTYMGSLTTPPCSEGVLWMVIKQPLQLSADQIAIFSRLYSNNARPVQASNGRLVKETR